MSDTQEKKRCCICKTLESTTKKLSIEEQIDYLKKNLNKFY